jgi:hypothetical protein
MRVERLLRLDFFPVEVELSEALPFKAAVAFSFVFATSGFFGCTVVTPYFVLKWY